MESSNGESSVINERVYVALGRNIEESKSTLSWALENFGGHFRILHVHQPPYVPPPARRVNGYGLNPQALARQDMDDLLDEYIHICDQARVTAEKRYLEMQDIGKGIVELIELHAITKLVMGAAAESRYFEGMTELASMKAKFVNQHAHPSCSIWFICKGHLIFLREGDLNTFDMDITPASGQVSSAVESREHYVRSPSPGSVHSSSDSSEVEDDLQLIQYERGEGSNHHQTQFLGTDGSYNQELYEQLDRAMTEVASAKQEAFEQLIRRQKAEKSVLEATCKFRTFENLYNEELRLRKSLEESLARGKEEFEMMKKDNDELKMILDNILTNQTSGPSSVNGQEFLREFSFSEIQEATNDFDPSLKIEEEEYGCTTYKGLLYHTQVAIKMLSSDSSQGPSQYHQEVQVASKWRHPNLVPLIGVCPDAWALVYEYLPNGSLEKKLSRRENTIPLLWQTRIRICTDTCAALIFLHSSNGIVHGKLEPQNIFLGPNFTAKLRDFGLSQTREVSISSDVYSFGIILLQLLTGRLALNMEEIVQNALDLGNLNNVLDSTAGDWPFEQATELAYLALSCCEMSSSNRPDLVSEVFPVLQRLRTLCEPSSSNGSNPEEPSQPPSFFMCPISHEIMEDPLVAADGFTYEGEAIRSWLNNGHDTSPMTNLQLEGLNLIPNQTLRSAIQEWLQQHPM